MNTESWIVLLLAIFSLSIGIGLAFPLTKNLQRTKGQSQKPIRYFLIFIGIYLAECIAFAMGMCTQILTIGLSFIWGLVFSLWLRKCATQNKITRLAILVAVYGSLPTASFGILITILKLIQGGNILSGAEGIAFGIPEFLPWPFNSILGFSVALLIGTLILKIVVTTVTVRYITQRFRIKAD